MKNLHSGLDYKLYKIYLWGGIALVVAHIIISVVIFHADNLPGPQAYLVIAGPLLLWVAGIFLYWWWVFLFKGNKEQELENLETAKKFPEIKSLANWGTLHNAMSLHGGNIDAVKTNDKKARRPVIIFFGLQNLLALWVCGFVTLGSLEIISSRWFMVWLYGIIGQVVFMLPATYFLVGWGANASEEAFIRPLGLASTDEPALNLRSAGYNESSIIPISGNSFIFEGNRHNRLIHIESNGRDSLTVIQTSFSNFKAESRDGKITPGNGTPENIAKTLQNLRKAKRWKEINITANSSGIYIQRHSKKGTNMWLYDLWLAEYLLEQLKTT